MVLLLSNIFTTLILKSSNEMFANATSKLFPKPTKIRSTQKLNTDNFHNYSILHNKQLKICFCVHNFPYTLEYVAWMRTDCNLQCSWIFFCKIQNVISNRNTHSLKRNRFFCTHTHKWGGEYVKNSTSFECISHCDIEKFCNKMHTIRYYHAVQCNEGIFTFV